MPGSPGWMQVVSVPLVIGAGAVVTGGLVAAITGPAGWERGAWVAAYLVLVVGVAQLGLAAGLAWLSDPAPTRQAVGVGVVVWNLGHAAVLAGTLERVTWVVDAGGVLLVLVLLGALLAVRPGRRGWLLRAYRALVIVVLVSVPVGLVLARLRSG